MSSLAIYAFKFRLPILYDVDIHYTYFEGILCIFLSINPIFSDQRQENDKALNLTAS